MDNKQIGNRIKNRRKELKFTLQEIADMVGVASSTIQRYENGTISQYKLPVLESIAKAINVNPTWLVKEDAKMETDIPDDIFVTENKLIVKSSEPVSFKIKISDYLSSKSKELSKAELMLLENFNKLNDLGKEEANKRIAELTMISTYTKTKDNVTELINNAKEEPIGRAAHNDFANDPEQQRLMQEDLDEL